MEIHGWICPTTDSEFVVSGADWLKQPQGKNHCGGVLLRNGWKFVARLRNHIHTLNYPFTQSRDFISQIPNQRTQNANAQPHLTALKRQTTEI